jgi:Zn-dependent M28 family amino/carboxypeptidase
MKFALGLLASLIVAAGALHWYTLVMPGRLHSGPLPQLSEDERAMAVTMRGFVRSIASRPHNTSFPEELEASARQIEATLKSFGYSPKAQKFIAGGIEVRNIEVVIEPAGVAAASLSTLVVGAHYDSAGDAPGANDNGSGVAALLILARELKQHPARNTRLRLVFFVNEEPPHFKTDTMGSLVYARALAASGERVRGMLSLETLGSYSDVRGSQHYPPPLQYLLPDTGNFVAVVGDMSARSLAADVTGRFRAGTAFPSIGGIAPAALPGITWSDHWSFSQFRIPAVMITDTAIFRYGHYHLRSDTPDKLDYERLARVTAGLVRVVAGLAP